MADEAFKAALAGLSKKGIAQVECGSLELNDYKMALLITAMEHSPADPKYLDVSNNTITSASMAYLTRYLATASIETVNLRNNQIDDSGALSFVSLFERASPIKLLDLRGNTCSVATASRLYYLSKSANYPDDVRAALLTGKATHIAFSGMEYIDLDKELLQYLLLHVEGLESVDFSGMDLGTSGMQRVGAILKDTQLTTIAFRECTLTNDTALKFVESADLPHHPTLRSFDFSTNFGLTNDFARKLVTTIFNENGRITQFTLTDTSVTSQCRTMIQKECELNLEHPAIKRVVVALRSNAPEAQEINLQWDSPLPTCMNYLADFIGTCTVIQHLNVSNTLIDDAGLELLCEALQKNISLRILELANCRITATGISSLFAILRKGKCNIEEVNIASNNLGEDSVKHITAALRGNPRLTILNVNNNPDISAVSMQEIAGLTMVNRAPQRIRKVLPPIENNVKDVVALDFSGSDVAVNDDSVWLLTQALRLNSVVRTLNLSHNCFGDAGAAYLADYLESNRTLLELNLSSCAIGNRGAEKLCAALATNQRLLKLDLSDNTLGADGVGTLPTVLRTNPSLTELKLERTRVSPEFIQSIVVACSLNRECPALKELYYRLLDGDASLTRLMLTVGQDERPINDESVRIICSVLVNKPHVEVIDLSGNQIGKGGCAAIAAVLSDSQCNVRKVVLSENPIDDYAVAELAACFTKTEMLREVVLCNTDITNAGIEILVKGLEANSSIIYLSIVENDGTGTSSPSLQRILALNNGPAALKKLLLSIDAGTVVEDVDLSQPVDCSIDDTLCQILCASLVQCGQLRSLNLAHNEITSASVPHIVEVAEMCPALTYVDLAHNEMDERGAQQLISCLERISHIHTIRIAGNSFSAETVDRVAHLVSLNMGSDMLKQLLLATAHGNPLPEEIDLNGTTHSYRLRDEEIVVLAGLLHDSTTVKFVDLGNNDFSDEGCVAIAEVLRTNHTMEALNLGGNAIGAEGGEALYVALKVNPQLQHLGLEGTSIPRDVNEDILSLMHVNQTPYRKLVNMRGMPLTQVDNELQFRSTDYYVAQSSMLGTEAVDNYKQPQAPMIEGKM